MWNLWVSLSEKHEVSSMFGEERDMSEFRIIGQVIGQVNNLKNHTPTNRLRIGENSSISKFTIK